MNRSDPLFPTFVVGSLPRPQWVRDLIEDRKAGRISEEEADRLLDDVVPSAIRMQERAGVDYISDGEWRRESYVKVFTEAVDGFTNDLVSSGGTSSFTHLMYPAVTSRISTRRSMAAGEVEFMRKHTDSKIIVAIPSPYTVGGACGAPTTRPGRTRLARSSSRPALPSSTRNCSASPRWGLT